MKSRQLLTVHDLVASNYTITPLSPGKYLHSFTPLTTSTKYQFIANSTPVIEVGERYNIGYTVDTDGRNIIDISALSKSSEVNPILSLMAAEEIARSNHSIEKAKNDQRVSYSATNGYYWGRKYAWRRFGMVVAKNAFFHYLEEINHPSIPCLTQDPDRQDTNIQSIAYKEDGLEQAINDLITSARKEGTAYYKSPHYTKKFSIRGINAITDKK